MRWQIGVPGVAFAIALFIGGIFLGSRLETSDVIHSTAAERLQPVGSEPAALTAGGTVYVPVYSSVYLGLDVKRQIRLSSGQTALLQKVGDDVDLCRGAERIRVVRRH